MSLIQYANDELRLVGYSVDAFDPADLNGHMHDALIELLVAFERKAPDTAVGRAYLLETFARLARRQPLSPLTGTDDEWSAPDAYRVQQNLRCETVYRDGFDGVAYDTHAILFKRLNGNCYALAGKSVKHVTFPYTPNPEIRDYAEDQSAVSNN
jgi:hypothetical protein